MKARTASLETSVENLEGAVVDDLLLQGPEEPLDDAVGPGRSKKA
jgi:hypothetical protein